MSESGKIRSQPNPQEVESLATGSLNPAAARSRASSMLGQISGHNDEIEINIHQQQRPLITKQKNTKWHEWNRRYDRIVDIANMLQDNDALSPDERAWLVNLGSEHYEQYCQLGDLLQVSMLGSPGRHGVWRLEDRNKVRMQIIKAALHEAMELAPPDNRGINDTLVIECALRKAEQVRKAMLRDTGCRNIEAHKYVTRKTLQDPRIFYAISNRKHANAMLRQLVKRPSDINSHVSRRDQRRAAKALELLVNNDLLDANAAMNLLHHLRKKPQHITALMSGTTPRLVSKADRQKVRALALLALAYNDSDVAKKMKGGLLTKYENTVQERFRRLLDLPSSGGGSRWARKMWRDWATHMEKGNSGSFSIDSDSVLNADAGGNNDGLIGDERKKDIDNLSELKVEADSTNKNATGQMSNKPAANLIDKDVDLPGDGTKYPFITESIVEQDPLDKNATGRISNGPVANVIKKDKDFPDLPDLPKNNAYKRMDPALFPGDLRADDVDSPLDYDDVEDDLHNKPAQSRPVVLELRRNNDDRKLMVAMAALEGQEWSKTPLGSSPLFQPGDNFTTASSKLSNYLGVFKLAADTMLGAPKDDKMPLTVTPHILGVIADARANAMTARNELSSLRKKLNAPDVSQQDPDGGKRAAFKKDVAILMDQLNAIIQHTGLILYRVNNAAREQSGSPKYSEDNNNNNNAV